MPTLKILSGVNAGQIFDLNETETLVGRDHFCDITLPVRTVSRRHARIIRSGDLYYVEDLGSVNGTKVNGERISGRVALHDQDRIRIHDNILSFELPHGPAQSDTVPVADIAAEEARDDTPSHILSEVDVRATGRKPSPDGRVADPSLAKLQAVIELTKNLGSSLEFDKVLPGILECLFELFPQTQRGYILHAEDSQHDLMPVAIKHRSGTSDTISPLGGKVVARVMSEGTAFLSSDAISDDRLAEMSESVLEEEIRSVMCAPLIGPTQKPLGVIHIETSDPRQPFGQGDLDMLISVANLAGRAAEAAHMHEAILALDRQKRELDMARDVQLHFLPRQRPTVEGYQFYDYYRAADRVAGDYYDYIEMPDGRLALVLGDVAGKGISAALLMARLCSEVRYCLLASDTPAHAVGKLNRKLHGQVVGDRFVTLVLMLLDPQRHTLSIVNAGHSSPLMHAAGAATITDLGCDEVCLPLGVESTATYEQLELALAPGDVVLASTDGVIEALNSTGDVYGNQRVRDVFLRTHADPIHVGQALIADVRAFAEGRSQSDDICLLCFGRNA